MPTMVDVNIPRFNQACVAVLTATAYIIDAPWLVAVTAGALAAGYFGGPRFAIFTQLYVRAVRPRVDPTGPRELEPSDPPRFAQLLGTLFLGGASLSFVLGLSVAGWALALVVTALASLAAATRICIGCLLYEKALAR